MLHCSYEIFHRKIYTVNVRFRGKDSIKHPVRTDNQSCSIFYERPGPNEHPGLFKRPVKTGR